MCEIALMQGARSHDDSGELQIGEIGTPPATTALANGARFRILGSGVRRRALQYIVVSPAIHSWVDLKGKSIGALSKGSCSYWFARLVLERQGINPDADVELVGLGPRYANVVDLIQSGELQAAIISEPNIAIGEGRGVLRILKALTEPEFCPTMQWKDLLGVPPARTPCRKRLTLGQDPALTFAPKYINVGAGHARLDAIDLAVRRVNLPRVNNTPLPSGHHLRLERIEIGRFDVGLPQIDVEISQMVCVVSVHAPEKAHDRPSRVVAGIAHCLGEVRIGEIA